MKLIVGEQAKKYVKGLPIAKDILVRKDSEIENAIKRIGFPMVIKLISKQLAHKTDIGGVKFVHNKEDLLKNYNEIKQIAKKNNIKLDGILFQEFVPGEWIFIGIKNDKTFGPIIMLGIGGIYVEVIKDISFRACPINESDAESMIQELKYKKILFGARGKPLNVKLLRKILIKASRLPFKHKFEELDINPLVLNDKNGKIVDIRVVI